MSSVLMFSALGVAAMVGLTWILGGLRTAVIEDCDAAADLMRRDFIAFEAGDAILSVDGTAAFLVPVGGDKSQGEKVGLVFAMGQRFATRLLSRGDVVSVMPGRAKRAARSTSRVEGVPLELRFADFTQPSLRVELPAGDETLRWRSRLDALCESGGGRGT